ncbi:hypothetical protein B0H16DRAFT_1696512 [Mycena metata]|uniref:Uncharacterized protein n=1 Tax=Mycena metata TaxID=1033252 RepID=A0AAD7MTF2_9AGAR|nr:hypothetical protein B0H16DRAFT_1696512 [Mycena metata]
MGGGSQILGVIGPKWKSQWKVEELAEGKSAAEFGHPDLGGLSKRALRSYAKRSASTSDHVVSLRISRVFRKNRFADEYNYDRKPEYDGEDGEDDYEDGIGDPDQYDREPTEKENPGGKSHRPWEDSMFTRTHEIIHNSPVQIFSTVIPAASDICFVRGLSLVPGGASHTVKNMEGSMAQSSGHQAKLLEEEWVQKKQQC